MVKLLLQYGALPNAKDQQSKTALEMAAYNDDEQTVRLLLSHEASVETLNQNGETPLLVVSKESRITMVSLLIQNGADIEATDMKKFYGIALGSKGRGC